MYKRDDNLCIIKSVQKLTDRARCCRAEIFKILHSVDILFKNTKWPTCVYMVKNITQTVVIYFNQAIEAEDRMVAILLCLVRSTCYLSPRVRNTCTKICELSGYITPGTHYSRFLDG